MIVKATDAALAVAVKPLVAGDPADAVAHAQLRHRPMATLDVLNEMVSFEHGIGLQPGHPSFLPPTVGRSVSHVPGHL